MRWAVAFALATLFAAAGLAQDLKPLTRYGVVASFNRYPQGTPKEALASVLRAIDNQQIDYVLAHLTDPAFVNGRVKLYGGKFEEVVEEARTKLAGNPAGVKLLRRFLKEGEWQEAEDAATARLKDVKDQQVFLKRIDKRWYLENRMKPMAEGK